LIAFGKVPTQAGTRSGLFGQAGIVNRWHSLHTYPNAMSSRAERYTQACHDPDLTTRKLVIPSGAWSLACEGSYGVEGSAFRLALPNPPLAGDGIRQRGCPTLSPDSGEGWDSASRRSSFMSRPVLYPLSRTNAKQGWGKPQYFL